MGWARAHSQRSHAQHSSGNLSRQGQDPVTSWEGDRLPAACHRLPGKC